MHPACTHRPAPPRAPPRLPAHAVTSHLQRVRLMSSIFLHMWSSSWPDPPRTLAWKALSGGWPYSITSLGVCVCDTPAGTAADARPVALHDTRAAHIQTLRPCDYSATAQRGPQGTDNDTTHQQAQVTAVHDLDMKPTCACMLLAGSQRVTTHTHTLTSCLHSQWLAGPQLHPAQSQCAGGRLGAGLR